MISPTDKVVVTQACPDCHGVGEHHPACSFALPHPLDAALTPPVTDLEGLIERLRATKTVIDWRSYGTEELINPDGPEAAAALSRLEAEKRELVGQIAQFVADWNGVTADGNTFLIAEEIREKFGSKLNGDPS